MSGTLHVIEDLAYGGAATQLRLLSAAGVARGEGVTIASLRRPTDERPAIERAGARVEWLGRRFGVDPFAARRLRRLIARSGARVVQTWDEPSARLFCLASAGLWRPRWLHTVREARSRRPGGEPWFGRLLRSADGVVVPSRDAAGRARRLGAAETRVFRVPNAFDAEAFAAEVSSAIGEEPREAARAELGRLGLGVSAEAPVVVAVARLDDAQRVKEIAWHADLLRAVRPGLRLLIVGDGGRRLACERFADQAAEAGTVRFLGAQAAWPRVLSAADVVWCASRGSAEPTPIVEAMAAGRPVVASLQPGRERLLDDQTGRLVPWDDRAEWARQTDRLLGDRDASRRLGLAAARRVREEHTVGAVSTKHAAALAG